MVDLMLQAYETGIPTVLQVEIRDSAVKGFFKEESFPAGTNMAELENDVLNGTITKCIRNSEGFAIKRKVNIAPAR